LSFFYNPSEVEKKHYLGFLLFQYYFFDHVRHHKGVTGTRTVDSNHEEEIQILW